MDIVKHFKRMILEQECALTPEMEQRILNDQATEKDIALMKMSYENMLEVRKMME